MRQKLKLVALSILTLSAGMAVKAQDSLKTTQLDEFVFTGTRVETPLEKSGKMIYRISAQDILTSGAQNAADLLNRVPGIQMDGNFGAPGTNLDYFVRGASSKRTLILIDGVPFNDPSGIDMTYDLRLLDLQQVESIEVLRGGLSSLYGTGAAAAVINIKMKKPGTEKLNLTTGISYGSFNTVGNNWNVNGQLDKLSYSGAFSIKSSEGFSAADDQGVGGFDKDGLKSTNASARIGYQVTKYWKMALHSSIDQFQNDFDGFAYSDDSQSGSEYVQKRIGTITSFAKNGTQLSGSFFKNFLDRRFEYGGFPDDYTGSNEQANLQINQKLGERFTLIGGLDYQKLAYEQPGVDLSSFETRAPYVSLMFASGGWNVQTGGRLNNQSDYGNHSVFNINPSYAFDFGPNMLKLLANYSTSYITPSLYQIAGPFGNPSLNPEESSNADVGMNFTNGNGFSINTVYFQRIDLEPIDFEAFFDNEFNFIGGQYYNADGKTRTEGVEMDFSYAVNKWSINGSYTWLNNVWGNLRQRVPRVKGGLGLAYTYNVGSTVSTNYTWTGKRLQNDPQTFELRNTSAFGLVDVNVNHRFGRLSGQFAVRNVFNKEYEAILGYTTVGRNYMVGVTMDLISKK